MIAGLAWPVMAVADHGGGHDRCEVTAGSGHDGGTGDDCLAPAAVSAPAAAPSPSPTLAVTAPPSPALPEPRPAARPAGAADGLAPRTSLLGGAALAALAALIVSGFRARHRLRQGWADGG